LKIHGISGRGQVLAVQHLDEAVDDRAEGESAAAELIERAVSRGYVTVGDIEAALAPDALDIETYVQQADSLFQQLEETGTSVYETESEAYAAGADEEAGAAGGNGSDKPGRLGQVAVRDLVGLYFAEIGDVPLLTHDDEIRLAKYIERGNEAAESLAGNSHARHEADLLRRAQDLGVEARGHLIQANTRLVVSIAKKYRGLGLPFPDLMQAGNLGLIRAVDKYDYRRGTRFSTFATWWIRQAVTRAVSKYGRTIRLPINAMGQIRKLKQAQQLLKQNLGRDPTPEEIASKVANLTPERIRWLLRVSREPLSLERPVGEDGDAELGSFIEDTTAPSPDDTAQLQLLKQDLAGMLESLPPREARALRMRFGLDGDRPLKLGEIGDRMGVTRERVRQIVVRALRRLRHPRNRRQLQEYLS
jgi:RNA polymerase primary sigma factor